ncbi:MAG: GNAT family N-acetyltransferase [Bacilli bacterium]|nr:GNAT family N-acetyltransferase [Bacilli bacterium]
MNNYFMKTKRLGFKKWNDNDLYLAIKLYSNPHVTKFISAEGVFSDEMIRDRFNLELSLQKKYGYCYWPVFLLDNDAFIGVCGLRPISLPDKGYVLEIGIHLLDTYWHCGYASEAMSKVIKYAFDDLKVDNLFAGHNPNNVRSKTMLLSLGFKFYQECYYEPTGLMHPSYLYNYD